MPSTSPPGGLYICLISVHGLIRGHDLELGRDADTGGQTRYVVELARALGHHDGVARVDLLTRRIVDPEVSDDYAQEQEKIGDNAWIVRIDAGPEDYIAKEQLWEHLDEFVDNASDYLRGRERLPDLLHSHYADAGYVGTRLSPILGSPLIHTGHSLGRVKRRRLLANGLASDQIEETYNMRRRVEAEENTLASSERIIASTQQEIEEQHGLYDFYQPDRMTVIPPGTDLSAFRPPEGNETDGVVAAELERFLEDPEKPLILVLARPDPRKNLPTHIEAYASNEELKEKTNMLLIAGTRDDIAVLERGAREVLTDILLLIDKHDLYGKVAYPKQIGGEYVGEAYRLAALLRGVHVNAALTEPFGLTLIEAAASGVPIVATNDGGPSDIIGNCENGVLVDPLDADDIASGILEVLFGDWDGYANSGSVAVREHYSWSAHASRYLSMVRQIADEDSETRSTPRPVPERALYYDRALVTDIDQNLLGAPGGIPRLAETLRKHRRDAAFVIATGRRIDAALRALRRHALPEPDVLITSGGTSIHYAPALSEETAWAKHIDRQWTPHVVRRILADVPGLELQPPNCQSRFKISYFIDQEQAPSPEEIHALLFQEEQSVNSVVSFGQFLDILPIRASKGLALRYAMGQWGIPMERVLVAGGSGADEDMMRGNPLAAVVANRHDEELSALLDTENVCFASESGALGILEAIEHFDFFGACVPPQSAKGNGGPPS